MAPAVITELPRADHASCGAASGDSGFADWRIVDKLVVHDLSDDVVAAVQVTQDLERKKNIA